MSYYPASRRDRICTLTACIMAVLLMIGMAVVLSGCDVGEARQVIETADAKLSDAEARLAEVEANSDPQSMAIAAEIRQEIADIRAGVEIARAVLERSEDWWGVAESALAIAAAAGVPFAGVAGVLVGGVKPKRKANEIEQQAKSLVSNIAKVGLVESADPAKREALKKLNIEAGVQPLVKSVTG